jgi:hypothetical protein
VKLTHVVDEDVPNVMCQADLYESIFWLRNPPVMVAAMVELISVISKKK